MSIIGAISLFGIMCVLAAVPSTSVALVVTRSATLGIADGIAVSAGIVLGDLVFITMAILSLSVVAEMIGGLFVIVKYLAASYLLWIGFSLLLAKDETTIEVKKTREKSSLLASFLAGFFLTLGDVKAIIFYSSLFPTFIDVSRLQAIEMLVIFLVAILSIGGVKILYALSAHKIASISMAPIFEKVTRKIAGGFMVGVGTYLIAKA